MKDPTDLVIEVVYYVSKLSIPILLDWLKQSNEEARRDRDPRINKKQRRGRK